MTEGMGGLGWSSGWIFIACEYSSTSWLCGWMGSFPVLTFHSRWESNEMMINVSCDALGYSGVPNPGREELDGILDAISAESKDSGLDQRFILAVMVSSEFPCPRRCVV